MIGKITGFVCLAVGVVSGLPACEASNAQVDGGGGHPPSGGKTGNGGRSSGGREEPPTGGAEASLGTGGTARAAGGSNADGGVSDRGGVSGVAGGTTGNSAGATSAAGGVAVTAGGSGGNETIAGGHADQPHGGAPSEGGMEPGLGGTCAGGIGGEGGGAGAGGDTAGSTSGSGGGGALGCYRDQDCGATEHCIGSAQREVCVPEQSVCYGDSDCESSSFCDGYCRPAPRSDEQCSPLARCGRGDDGTLLTCVLGICTAGSADRCGSDRDCGSGTFCSRDSNSSPLTCAAPSALGESCATKSCASGLACLMSLPPDPRAIQYTCVKPTGCFVGPPETVDRTRAVISCPAGSYCDRQVDGACQPGLDIGETCSPLPPSVPFESPVYPACRVGAFCKRLSEGAGDPGVCVASPGIDERCARPPESAAPGDPVCLDDANRGCSPCASGLTCHEGYCRTIAQAGEDCSRRSCADGLGCARVPADGTCSPRKGSTQRVVSVVVSPLVTCVLVNDGNVECWGYPPLGDGSSTYSDFPRRVANLSGPRAISMGNGSVCVLEAAGTVACWTTLTFGPLRRVPTAVAGLPLAAVALQAGSCALLTDGSVWCWGADLIATQSQPGGGGSPVESAGSAEVFENCVTLDDGELECTSQWPIEPRAVRRVDAMTLGLHDVRSVSTQNAGGCAVDHAGALYCWGAFPGHTILGLVRMFEYGAP